MTPLFGPAEARLVLDFVGLPSLRFEHVVTRRVIAAIPREHMDFRPAAGARSAGELARHIVGTELRFLDGAATGTFPDVSADLAAADDAAAIVGLYDTRFPLVLERLAASEGEVLLRHLDYRGLMRLPALGFVQFALNHTIHHRGQLSVYLRAVGAAVPSIYG